MAISTTWSVSNMVRNEADGGVVTVYWSIAASDQTALIQQQKAASYVLTPDASS